MNANTHTATQEILDWLDGLGLQPGEREAASGYQPDSADDLVARWFEIELYQFAYGDADHLFWEKVRIALALAEQAANPEPSKGQK